MNNEEYVNQIVEDAEEWGRNNEPQEDAGDGAGWLEVVGEITKRFGALIMIILLLYIYGIHQGLMFRQTPDDVVATKGQYPPVKVVAASSTIDVPVHIYTLVDRTRSTTSSVNISQLMQRTAAVWNQAKIDFSLMGTTTVAANREKIVDFLSDPTSEIRDITEVKSGQINVFVTPALGGLNGVAFRGLQAVAVAEYTTSFDFRVLAHEFGHIFGLRHTNTGGRLMQQGGHGDDLSKVEVIDARTKAADMDLNKK